MLPNQAEKRKALEEHFKKFSCSHERTELRSRKIAGGGIQRVYQCLRCGEPSSSPISREKALELCGGKEPLPFDDVLKQTWEQSRALGTEKILEEHKEKFWQGYDSYLSSDKWKLKREAVINRANGICEGCGKESASEVHHLSYEHVGDEFLFELVAICAVCHERIHPEDDK